MRDNELPPGHRSGFVAIVGRPNVGKSTLLNNLVRYKVAIVTHKPQTTRNRIVGIRTTENSQIVFVDTPGIHDSSKPLNRAMLDVVRKTIADVDVILYMVDSRREQLDAEERFTLEVVSRTNAPRILVPNKVDLVKKEELLPLIARFTEAVSFEEVVPISALKGEGLETLMEVVTSHLPEGPRYYPPDQMSELRERDIAAEIIREKIFLLTHREIPYSSAVVVEEFKEVPERELLHIQATIHVEKNSQKGIIIGKGGSMLKKIGQTAREELERLFGAKVFLELYVRVEKNWTRDPKALRKLGLLEQ